MGYREAANEILESIIAQYPFLYIVSDDDNPVIKTFVQISKEKMVEKTFDVLTWNLASGFFTEYGDYGEVGFKVKDQNHPNIEEKVKALYEFVKNYTKDAIFVLQDFDYIFRVYPHLTFGLKELINTISLPLTKDDKLKRYQMGTKKEKHVVIVSSNQYIPKELEKMVNVIYFGMPGREEIERIVNIIEYQNETPKLSQEEKEEIIRAAFGLTEPELINALYKSIAKNGKMDAKELNALKEQIIRKGGILDYVPAKVGGFKNIGGMKELLSWIERRTIAFNEKVRLERKLPYPKGIVMVGVQGAGKSYTAKAIAEFLEVPLIRFDIGRIKGKYVGESEENMRKAIALAEAVSPCVLWIDEIEKAFPNPNDINTHEVTKGLLGYFLTWMQEKTKPVFVVATANGIDTLPPELLRKGRFDEIFWVDLPDEDARKQIFEIHLRKIGVDPKTINVELIARKSEGFSGAEIETLVQEANYQSAYDGKPVNTEYILEELEKTTPISVIRADAIEQMRKWAKDNQIRPAK